MPSRIARSYLFEQLSGLPVSSAVYRWPLHRRLPMTAHSGTKVANFPQHLTRALATALDEHA